MTSTIISAEYINALTFDNLDENQFLIVKRGIKYDLANEVRRKQACRVILGLLRYLLKEAEDVMSK